MDLPSGDLGEALIHAALGRSAVEPRQTTTRRPLALRGIDMAIVLTGQGPQPTPSPRPYDPATGYWTLPYRNEITGKTGQYSANPAA